VGCDETYLLEIAWKLLPIQKKNGLVVKISDKAYVAGMIKKMKENGGPAPEDLDLIEKHEEDKLQARRQKEAKAEEQRQEEEQAQREQAAADAAWEAFSALSEFEKARIFKEYCDEQSPAVGKIDIGKPYWLICFKAWLGKRLKTKAA
jgi:hypothetical protein